MKKISVGLLLLTNGIQADSSSTSTNLILTSSIPSTSLSGASASTPSRLSQSIHTEAVSTSSVVYNPESITSSSTTSIWSAAVPIGPTSSSLLSTPSSSHANIPASNIISISGSQTPTVTQGPSMCCFVVQDTVNEIWWTSYTTWETMYSLVNVTLITTLVTPYPSTTITNFETNVFTSNASFPVSSVQHDNPISLLPNPTATPFQSSTQLANGSSTVIGGTTILWPHAAVVYSTVKIITAAAVTDSAGNVVCGTASNMNPVFVSVVETDLTRPTVITATTTYVTKEYSTFTSGLLVLTGTATITSTNTRTSSIGYSDEIFGTTTYTDTGFLEFTGINSNAEDYFNYITYTSMTDAVLPTSTISDLTTARLTAPTGVIISLTDPWVYFPSSTRTWNGDGEAAYRCEQGNGTDNYGYPVQGVLDYLVGIPSYSSQYPGLASCLPAGPAIVHLSMCSVSSPVVATAGFDLTSSTIITVTPTETEPSTSSASILAGLIATTTQVSATITSLPKSSTVSETTILSISTTVGVLTTQSQSPVLSTGSSRAQVQSSSVQNFASPSSSITQALSENNSPLYSPATLTTLLPTIALTVPTSSSSVINSVAGAIASQIASIIGAVPLSASEVTTPGASEYIIAASITIPLNPSLALSGFTTIISGTTNVIVSSTRTILASEIINSLPGSTTAIEGALNVVISTSTLVPVNPNLPALTGLTTVISSESYVVVNNPTTVPVVMGNPTKTNTDGGWNSIETGLAQVTGSGVGRIWANWELVVAFSGLVVLWVW